MTPTYGNTLMGLACSKPVGPHDGYKISYYAPQPRAAIQVVDFDNYEKTVEYGQSGRVLLTTLTKEFFMPRFPERDEGEREPPYRHVPVGRRERRPAVPRDRGHDDGRRVLIRAAEPVVRQGRTTSRYFSAAGFFRLTDFHASFSGSVHPGTGSGFGLCSWARAITACG